VQRPLAGALGFWRSRNRIAYFTCPETCLVISNMVTCFFAAKNSFECIISVDQRFLFFVLKLVFLDVIPELFGHFRTWKDSVQESPKRFFLA
jgi:hypothetical protein